MTQVWAPAFLAALLGGFFSWLELITGKYPRTFFLLLRNNFLYLYSAVYGGAAFLLALLFRTLVKTQSVSVEGIGVQSPWVQAIIIGVTVKAFLHISFFTATVGTQRTPIGIETVTQLFEPWLLRKIEFDEFDAVRSYVIPRAAQYNLVQSKDLAKNTVPPSLSPAEQTALKADIDNATTVVRVLEIYLAFAGRGLFDRVFPG